MSRWAYRSHVNISIEYMHIPLVTYLHIRKKKTPENCTKLIQLKFKFYKFEKTRILYVNITIN